MQILFGLFYSVTESLSLWRFVGGVYHNFFSILFTQQPLLVFSLLSSVLTASQTNGSLKKQRSRSIFSTFFCCFRNYNVEPPTTNSNTAPLPPPPAEENGSPPKVSSLDAGSLYISTLPFLSPNCFILFFSLVCVIVFPSSS